MLKLGVAELVSENEIETVLRCVRLELIENSSVPDQLGEFMIDTVKLVVEVVLPVHEGVHDVEQENEFVAECETLVVTRMLTEDVSDPDKVRVGEGVIACVNEKLADSFGEVSVIDGSSDKEKEEESPAVIVPFNDNDNEALADGICVTENDCSTEIVLVGKILNVGDAD